MSVRRVVCYKRRDSRAGRQKQEPDRELDRETNEGTHIGEKREPPNAGNNTAQAAHGKVRWHEPRTATSRPERCTREKPGHHPRIT